MTALLAGGGFLFFCLVSQDLCLSMLREQRARDGGPANSDRDALPRLKRTRSVARASLPRHIDHVIVGNPIDELVIRIDPCSRWFFVDDNLKSILLLSQFLFLEV
jgi:hypothetical protein